MSEEILKALMQLFALITKQDGGISQQEIDYVNRFLEQQIGVDSAQEYLRLYLDTAEGGSPGKDKEPASDTGKGPESASDKEPASRNVSVKPTPVMDSVLAH